MVKIRLASDQTNLGTLVPVCKQTVNIKHLIPIMSNTVKIFVFNGV